VGDRGKVNKTGERRFFWAKKIKIEGQGEKEKRQKLKGEKR